MAAIDGITAPFCLTIGQKGETLKRSGAVLCLAATMAVAPCAALADTVAGVTPGALAVDEMGAATYAVPISVPPGVAGMEPSLGGRVSIPGTVSLSPIV